MGRLFLVPLAFLLALATAGFVLVTLGQERIVQGLGRDGPDESTIGAAFDLFRIARVLFSKYTLAPVLLLVIAGEVARIRSVIYYVLGAGAALAAVPLLASYGADGGLAATAVAWQVFATAGFAGGMVYWLVAGRGA